MHDTTTIAPTGFIGLGNMGGPMAANLSRGGFATVVFDAAGTEPRAAAGAQIAGSIEQVAQAAETVLLSLPDGPAVAAVTDALGKTHHGRATTVVDTSTIGIRWAQTIAKRCAQAGIRYLDAPVSGGVAGARAATIAMMYAGPKPCLVRQRARLETMAKNIFHVGEEIGQGQAMKVLNNFLSGTAMAATSEAVAFGVKQGLELETILGVLNVSTGRNTASEDKFVRRVLTQSYDAGFSCAQMNKDLSLYREGVDAQPAIDSSVSAAVFRLWQDFLEHLPGGDITEIYPFIKTHGQE